MKWDLARLIDQVRSVCEVTPEGCWIWRYGSWANRHPDAKREYPRLMIGGQRHAVARWVMVAKEGDAPGKEPCHSCDRTACVSPDHLHWGTHQENMQEMGERQRAGPARHPERYRGRTMPPASVRRGEKHPMRKNPELAARGDRHGSKTHPERWRRGTGIPWSKLDPEKVRAIRLRLAAGDTPSMIAPDFGVGRGSVRAIAEGRSWRHVA